MYNVWTPRGVRKKAFFPKILVLELIEIWLFEWRWESGLYKSVNVGFTLYAKHWLVCRCGGNGGLTVIHASNLNPCYLVINSIVYMMFHPLFWADHVMYCMHLAFQFTVCYHCHLLLSEFFFQLWFSSCFSSWIVVVCVVKRSWTWLTCCLWDCVFHYHLSCYRLC